MSYRNAGSSGDHTAQSPSPSSTNVRAHQIPHCMATSAEAKEVAKNGIMGSAGQNQFLSAAAQF